MSKVANTIKHFKWHFRFAMKNKGDPKYTLYWHYRVCLSILKGIWLKGR